MKRLQIGDVIEIKTQVGLAYAIYTHKAKPYGTLLRVFDTLYGQRPGSFNHVVLLKVRFSTFFPLQAALSRGLVEIAGHVKIPPQLQPFPLFRNGTPDPITKKVKTWWLWDGKEEWMIGELTEEQRRLPIEGIINYTMLVDRIESGWTPENDYRT
ncbi:MAG: hypothetical protein AB9866_02605 [Syntrophobacteraceae bacterium]